MNKDELEYLNSKGIKDNPRIIDANGQATDFYLQDLLKGYKEQLILSSVSQQRELMKPRQKAKEMIKESTKLGNSYCSKRHCIWLCDIILNEIYHNQEYPRYNYWQDVKKEINKI